MILILFDIIPVIFLILLVIVSDHYLVFLKSLHIFLLNFSMMHINRYIGISASPLEMFTFVELFLSATRELCLIMTNSAP